MSPSSTPLIDDVGVERGQGHGRDGLDGLEHHDQPKDIAVWPQVAAEDLPETHGRVPTPSRKKVAIVRGSARSADPSMGVRHRQHQGAQQAGRVGGGHGEGVDVGLE